MAFGIDDAVGAVSTLATTIINKVFPDPQDAAKAKALLEPPTPKRRSSRRPPSFRRSSPRRNRATMDLPRAAELPLCLLPHDPCIDPHGRALRFRSNHAQQIALGLGAWLAAIPDPVWQLFMSAISATLGDGPGRIKGVSR